MKRLLTIVMVLALICLLPADSVFARGGGGGGGGGRGFGGGGGLSRGSAAGTAVRNRSSRKDQARLRERSQCEDADALMRDAAGERRGR